MTHTKMLSRERSNSHREQENRDRTCYSEACDWGQKAGSASRFQVKQESQGQTSSAKESQGKKMLEFCMKMTEHSRNTTESSEAVTELQS